MSDKCEGVILDTNVYIDWADNQRLDLQAVLRHARADVYLCPSVVLELLDDYWTCHERQVDRSKNALRQAMVHADRTLPPEGAALRRALGMKAVYDGPLSAGNLTRCVEFCLALTSEQRASRNDGRRSFDLEGFLAALDRYREQYLGGREAFRDEIVERFGKPGERGFSPDRLATLRDYLGGPDWAHVYVRGVLDQTSDNIDETLTTHATELLSARLAFDTAVVASMLVDGYNPRKHRGDCFDCGILTHLADQDLHLVTSDRALVRHTSHTSQADRILSAHELSD